MPSKDKDLSALRGTATIAFVALLWAHLPVILAIGLVRGTDWLMPAAVMAALAGVSTLSWRIAGSGASTRLTIAVSLVGAVSLLVYQMAGNPWQVDLHMYYFAAIASLVAFCDYRAIIAAAGATALHHLTLNFLIPAAIYPGGSDFGRVVLHASIVVFESGVLIWIADTLSKLFQTTAEQIGKADAARTETERATLERIDIERRAKAEADTEKHALADDFERKIGRIVATIAVSAAEMQDTSSAMSGTADAAANQATAVAAASMLASANVQTVASATEELTASIGGIGQQAMRSAAIASKAADEASRTNTVVEGLAAGAQKIGEVVTLIQSIASQTNLRALNATIEAARAGEHGKGFAVVASEVKALANQTAKATEEISTQIQSIQAATNEAVGAIQAIGGTITEINDISGAIAHAVEQQEAATREIAGNVMQAARGTEEVNETTAGVRQASTEVGAAATRVQNAAAGISAQSERLRVEVDDFLRSVRTG